MSGLNPWTADDIKALAQAQLDADNEVEYLRDFDGAPWRVEAVERTMIRGTWQQSYNGEWAEPCSRVPAIGLNGNGFQLTDAGRAWLEQNRSHEPVGEVVNVPEPEAEVSPKLAKPSEPSLPKISPGMKTAITAAFRNQIACDLARENAGLIFTTPHNAWARQIVDAANTLTRMLAEPVS